MTVGSVGQVRSHRDLVVWQKAMDLVEMVYRHSKRFPSAENYGLVSQMTRAAISVPANIAEGNGRGSVKEYARFLGIAKGSLMETETYLSLAIRLGYVTDTDIADTMALIVEISKMLTAMRAKLADS